MDPVRILQVITEVLADRAIDGETPGSVDEPEGDDLGDYAEVRIGWGGRDLFDICIKRV